MVSEILEVQGHIIDSLILPKILDEILNGGGTFEILRMRVGKRQTDSSSARLRVSAPSTQRLATLLKRVARLGAVPVELQEVELVAARKDGVFPQHFYSTTNLPTLIRWRGRWRHVADIEMDCGIVVEPRTGRACCRTMNAIRRGDRVACGSHGVKVLPLERSRRQDVFQFMASAVSSEKPKGRLIRELAGEIRAAKRAGQKIMVVAGPAVVHTGAAPYLTRLIEAGYVDVLFAGNGLATHDIESALYGTSLGYYLDRGVAAKDGHDHHMRAINTIRDLGGIRQAVQRRVLTSGIMHACVRRGVRYVLAGSIRDDGPLPDVITDTQDAQEAMRKSVRGVGVALMIASTLHAIATGNLLPATVKTVCVDINPAVVTKLSDRGTFQNIGIVTDVESFLRELSRELAPARRR